MRDSHHGPGCNNTLLARGRIHLCKLNGLLVKGACQTGADHTFFASLLLFFVVQAGLLAPSPLKYGQASVTHAMYYQPRTPPPMVDPEQLNTSVEEAEAHPYGVAIR